MTDIKVFEGVSSVAFNEKITDTVATYEIFKKIGESGIDLDMISADLTMNDTLSVGFTLSDDDLPKLLPLIKSENISTPVINCGNVKFVITSEDMVSCPGYAAGVFERLKNAGCIPLMITTAVDEISVLVRDSDSVDAGKAFESMG